MNTSRQFMLIAVMVLLAFAGCHRAGTPRTSAMAVKELEYLSEQDGVNWHEVSGNNVYVGFSQPLPKDWKTILEEAALAGSNAIGAEFQASGITGEEGNWRAYADSNTVGIVTARDSQLVD